MLWVCAPRPTRRRRHSWFRPGLCGVVALSEFVEPTMTVRVKGVVEEMVLTASCKPGGRGGEAEDDRLRIEAQGGRRADAPPASVAVSLSSRYEGYSWSGALKEPLATPGQLWIVCEWQLEGQCWMRRSRTERRREGALLGVGRMPGEGD